MVSGNTPWWNKFLADVAAKTRCRKAAPAKLSYALSNAVARPVIYAAFGIHGNVLFPDAGYCEFDDPDRAWEHLMRWATVSGKWRDPPVVGDGGFPVGFEVGIVSLEEMAKTRPVWELLKQNNVEFINPLYSQPYLRHVGEESNVRQFEEGLASLHAHELAVEVFASSEHALHPQIPQLLRGFGIDRAFATVRLAGGGPTAYDPKVSWVGADGTKITSIASQSGLPNGHIWHGAFFEEMPGLIFAAVARPDLKQVVYANIEDIANPMPGSEDFVAHLAECAKNKIYFRGFKDIATDDGTIPISLEVRWSLDDFPIRLMLSELITATRNCEDLLVSVEAADALLASFGKRTHENELHDAWKKLLIAENHDAFVVPFTTPGMYSAQQGITINNQWDATETIEARCLRAIQEAEKIARTVLQDYTQGRGGEQRQALLNILWGREEVVNKTTYALPALGYAAEGTPYEPRHSLEVRGNSIVIDDTSVVLNREIQSSQQGDILEVQGEKWTARVDDRGARVEILIQANQSLEITVPREGELFATYPFGAEKTRLSNGHSLRFLWDELGMVLSHNGTPYFRQTDDSITLLIPKGEHILSLARAETLIDAYHQAWEFFYPPISFSLPENAPTSGQFIDAQFNGSVPTALRISGENANLRVLSIDGSEPTLPDGRPVDFWGNPVTIIAAPWKILNYRLPIPFKDNTA